MNTTKDSFWEEKLQAFLSIPPCPDFDTNRAPAQIVQERELFSGTGRDDSGAADAPPF